MLTPRFEMMLYVAVRCEVDGEEYMDFGTISDDAGITMQRAHEADRDTSVKYHHRVTRLIRVHIEEV